MLTNDPYGPPSQGGTTDRNTRARNRIHTISRRDAIGALGTLGVMALLGCGESDEAIIDDSDDLTNGDSTPDVGADNCVLIPEETEGPYPLDLSSNPSYFRQDITEGKTGIPLILTLILVNANNNCAPIANARVDIWHCDKDGVYSGYNQPGANTVGETFCRGIQLSDSSGKVKFTTIYPGWYAGRITHIHFQVYLNNGLVATSQIAFPEETTKVVYDTPLYAARGQNTSVANFAADNVFSDGVQYQMCTITDNPTTGGYDATLTVGVAA